jgi:aquaporin Z
MQRLIAEFIATFILVFIGTGAATVNEITGDITHAGVALSFGLVVLAMIYAVGDISGAHMNPAVTVAFAFSKRFAWKDVTGYIVAQSLGAIFASTTLRILFMESKFLGATEPAGTLFQSLLLEGILTFILMFVILCVSTGAKEKGIMAGGAIGSVIAFEAMMGGPICGASMNPARSFSPALRTGRLDTLWLYIVSPVLGAMLAVLAFQGMMATQNDQNAE